MQKKISKFILSAGNGILKGLIHDIIHNEDLKKFEKKFSANIERTTITITEKKGSKASPEDWNFLLSYLTRKTKNLSFSLIAEYVD